MIAEVSLLSVQGFLVVYQFYEMILSSYCGLCLQKIRVVSVRIKRS